MTIQTINIGSAANDGTGDDLREAFVKVNANFSELDLVAVQTAQNVGSSGGQVFKEQVSNTMSFRRIVGGSNINITELDNTLVVDGTVPDQSYSVVADNGSILLGNGQSFAIYGGEGVTTSSDNNASPNPQIIIDASLENDLSPVLAASLDANSQNITGVNNLSSTSSLTGTLSVSTTGTIGTLIPTNIKTSGTESVNYENNLGRFLTWDLGDIGGAYEGALQFIIGNQDVDLGTFTSPSQGEIDLGSI